VDALLQSGQNCQRLLGHLPDAVPVFSRDDFQKRPELKSEPDLCESGIKIKMKALLYAQFNPQKTMEQLVNDRAIYRYLIAAVLILSACG